MRVILDSKVHHALLEIIPLQRRLLLTEEREQSRGVLGSSAVGEVESHADVINSRGRGVGDELKSHGRGVVANAHEIRAGGLELGETEEGHEGAICAKLDVELGTLLAVDKSLESLDDLTTQDRAGDGSDAVTAVVGEVPLVN